MTLEETKEQITNKEKELSDLKNQKTELFRQLKKVLAEEGRRKDQMQQQQQQQQQNYLKENEMLTVHPYPHGTIPIGGHHPQMLFPSTMVAGRPANLATTLYKLPQPQQALIPQRTLKRTRTPSPPPPPSTGPTYQTLPYAFKSISGSQTSVVPVSLSTTSKLKICYFLFDNTYLA